MNCVSQIGFVTQDTQLFAGTIRENLSFVNPTQATMTKSLMYCIRQPARIYWHRSENGIDSVIGEGGMKVSGGEKQRLSIARALLQQTKSIGV
jgi:ATP-binding cassette subfamily B protein